MNDKKPRPKALPEGKKNTMENMTKELDIISKLKSVKPDFDKKESYQHGFHDGVDVAIHMIVTTATGSVAAPKEEWEKRMESLNFKLERIGVKLVVLQSGEWDLETIV